MSQVLSAKLLEILACPEDKGPLFYLVDENLLYNSRLRRAYVVVDGIPVMLIDEARQCDDTEHARIMKKVGDESIKPTFNAD